MYALTYEEKKKSTVGKALWISDKAHTQRGSKLIYPLIRAYPAGFHPLWPPPYQWGQLMLFYDDPTIKQEPTLAHDIICKECRWHLLAANPHHTHSLKSGLRPGTITVTRREVKLGIGKYMDAHRALLPAVFFPTSKPAFFTFRQSPMSIIEHTQTKEVGP